MLDHILSGKLGGGEEKKIVIEIVTFSQRLFQARDINKALLKHNHCGTQ